WILPTKRSGNHHIRTDAIKENLIPATLSKAQVSFVYANEAYVLNMALFGKMAKQWRDDNPDNIRDYASIEQLVVLSNMESANALLKSLPSYRYTPTTNV